MNWWSCRLNNVSFGRAGENIACKYLEKNNYSIIKRNFFYYGGEIDIVAYDKIKNELVFFEVKTRTSKEYGVPSDAVTKNKINNITKGINFFLLKNNYKGTFIRVDVLELYYLHDKFYINHIKQVI